MAIRAYSALLHIGGRDPVQGPSHRGMGAADRFPCSRGKDSFSSRGTEPSARRSKKPEPDLDSSPGLGRAVFVVIFLTPPQPDIKWPGESAGSSLLAKVELGGEVLWVVHHSVELPENVIELIQKSRWPEKEIPDRPNLRHLLYGNTVHGERFFVEVNPRWGIL